MSDRDAEQLAAEFRQTDPRELREDCPATARLWAAVAGQLRPEEVRGVVDHTARCMDCSIAWRVALEVHRDTSPAPATLEPPLRSRLAASMLLPGGLTLIAAGIAAGLFFLGPWPHPNQRAALAVEGNSERGTKSPLDSLTPSAVQPRDAVVLRWSPYPGAQRYSVTIMSTSLEVLYRGFAETRTELRIPSAALAAQPKGGRVLWSVQAMLPDGRTIDSDVFAVDFQ